MPGLFTQIWPALAAAFLIGAVIGAWSCVAGRSSGRGIGLGMVLFAMLGAGLVASFNGALSGREAVWLSIATAMLAVYLGGCCLGWTLRRLTAGATPVSRTSSARPPR